MEAEVPASQLLTWDLRMPTNQVHDQVTPRLYWALLRLTLLRTPGNEVSSLLVFLPLLKLPAWIPCAPWGWTGRSGVAPPAVDDAELYHWVGSWLHCAAELCRRRICRKLILWRAEALIKCNNNHSFLSPGGLPLPWQGSPRGRLHADLWGTRSSGDKNLCRADMPSALRQPLAGDQGLHTGNDCSHLWVTSKRGLLFLGIVFWQSS